MARLALLACAAAVGLLGVLVGLTWAPLLALDAVVSTAATGWVAGRPEVADGLRLVTDVLAPWPLRGLVLLAAGLAWLRGHAALAGWAVGTLVAGGLLGAGLKLALGRDRPELENPLLDESGFAWPSGHALTGALAAGILVVVARRAWAVPLAVTGAVAVGASRVLLGVHWPSDVLAGWLLGVAVVLAATAAGPHGVRAPGRSRRPPGVGPRA